MACHKPSQVVPQWTPHPQTHDTSGRRHRILHQRKIPRISCRPSENCGGTIGTRPKIWVYPSQSGGGPQTGSSQIEKGSKASIFWVGAGVGG